MNRYFSGIRQAAAAKSALWIPDLMSGLVLGFTVSLSSISVITLIFSGDLQPYRAQGMNIALVTVALNLLLVALFASGGTIISTIQSNPSAILGVAITAAVGSMTSAADKLPTALAMIFVVTFLTGIVMLILGYTRLSDLMRYLPYPVIGGFLAGAGLLVVKGAFFTMTNLDVTLNNLPAFLLAENLIRWLPGVIFGVVLLAAMRANRPHVLTLPGLMVGGIALFFLALRLTNTSIDEARRLGLLMEELNLTGWRPLQLADVDQADWGAIWQQAGSIITISLLTILTLLLNISSTEILFRRELQVNQELKVAGFTNLLTSLMGGSIGFHSLSLTTLNHHMGGRRVAGVIASLSCFGIFLGGHQLLLFIPIPLLGGTLFFLGMSFVDRWIIRGWKDFSPLEYSIVLVIVVVIIANGVLLGVTVGLVAAIILFALTYSRIDIFQHQMAGSEVRSTVERAAYYGQMLDHIGEQTYVMELRGYLFFGTANRLLEAIRARLAAPNARPLLFLILDFRRVIGVDSSAVLNFVKAYDLAASHHCTLCFCHLSDNLRQALSPVLTAENTQKFADIDHALEWCEDRLLEIHQITSVHIPTTLFLQLKDAGMGLEPIEQMRPFLERVEFAVGDYLIRQGNAADELYLIESGKVSVYLEQSTSQPIRVQSLGFGTMIGELAFFLHQTRSASVLAEAQTVTYRLTRASLDRMKAESPEAAIAFNEMMLNIVARRVLSTNRSLEALNR